MDRFSADYFDGRSSSLKVVEVVVHAGRAVIRGDGVAAEFALSELTVHPRMGAMPRRIELPGGGLLVTQAEIDTLLGVPPAKGLAHRLESRTGFIVASLFGLAIAFGVGYRYGIPWLAREVAFNLPPALEEDIAREGMSTLDRYVFKPTSLTRERQEELRTLFGQMTTAGVVPARIEFRDGRFLGANAFALPGGVVVVTDQLVELFKDDGPLAAVLAHEVGHLEYRHGTRHILQDSIASLLAAAVLGDVSSVGNLVATLPVMLSNTSNSREFEREADAFAFQLLKKTGRSPRLLGEALAALEKQRDSPARDCPVPLEGPKDAEGAKPESKPPRRSTAGELGYLSTHPATEERIKAAEEAAR